MNLKTEETAEEAAKRVYLDSAIRSLDTCGRYWNSTIPRPTAKALVQLLKDNGYKISVMEIPPLWEHVFFISNLDLETIQDIAKARAKLINEQMETHESLTPNLPI